MSLKVKYKDWKNVENRKILLEVAELLNEDIEIRVPKQKFKSYNASIWLNDDIVTEKDFNNRSNALKWIKQNLSKKKYLNAFCDLKKYNKRRDDFDWWFYRMQDNILVEVDSPEN